MREAREVKVREAREVKVREVREVKVREAAKLLPELVSGVGVSGVSGVVISGSGFGGALQFSVPQHTGLYPLSKKKTSNKRNAFDRKSFCYLFVLKVAKKKKHTVTSNQFA